MNYFKEFNKLYKMINENNNYKKVIEDNIIFIKNDKKKTALSINEFIEILTNKDFNCISEEDISENIFFDIIDFLEELFKYSKKESFDVITSEAINNALGRTNPIKEYKKKILKHLENIRDTYEEENRILFCETKENKYYLNEVIKGDSIKILKSFPDKSINCIFADPPYFMQSTTRNGKEKKLMRADGTGEFKGCDDAWDKYKDYEEYDKFCNDWLKECKRVLKDDGTIWVIGSFQNIYRLGYIMQNMGFWILNDIVWAKLNPTPNMAGTRFCNAHETMLWCSKGEKNKFTFNYKTMKYLNNDKQDRSVWDIGICQGNERLKDEKGNNLHDTEKPVELMKILVENSSQEKEIVLDPFIGIGATAIACINTNRNYIGFEIDERYYKIAEKRINDSLFCVDKI